jgi:hypothetical protein
MQGTRVVEMLTDEGVEQIRQGVRNGTRGPVMLLSVEKLLRDGDERIQRDRALATQLLCGPGTTQALSPR